MYNYNIPQKGYYKPTNFKNNGNYVQSYPSYTTTSYTNGDRFIGGGFLAPFLLGGVGGYLIGRPNYNNQGPIPVYFPNGGPGPVYPPYPPYSNTNIYY